VANYAIFLIAVGCAMLLLALVYFLYSKYNRKSSYKYRKIRNRGPIREVWSDPDIDNTNNIIMWDMNKGLGIKSNTQNALYSNVLHPKPENQTTSNLIEFD
jgi:hypothetical protein